MLLSISEFHHRQDGARRTEAVQMSRDYLVAMAAFDYQKMDANRDHIVANSTHGFAAKYDEMVKALRDIVVTSKGVATATADHVVVDSLDGDTATVVAFVDQHVANVTAPQGTNQKYRMVVKLVRSGDRWIVDDVADRVVPCSRHVRSAMPATYLDLAAEPRLSTAETRITISQQIPRWIRKKDVDLTDALDFWSAAGAAANVIMQMSWPEVGYGVAEKPGRIGKVWCTARGSGCGHRSVPDRRDPRHRRGAGRLPRGGQRGSPAGPVHRGQPRQVQRVQP